MIQTREPLGSYAEHVKYAGAGSAQVSGAAQGPRSNSYAPRAPASSHGPLHSSQRAGNPNNARQSGNNNNMRSRD